LEASVLEFDGVPRLRSRRFGPAIELFTRAREMLAHAEQTPDSQRADLLLRYHTGRACTGLGRLDEAELAEPLAVLAVQEAGRRAVPVE
jgi:hypothetical protein